MTRYFRCKHCHKLYPCNIRLKVRQKYCGSKVCQQARKSLWEREKVHGDEEYSNRRKASKAAWRKRRPADIYQSDYRGKHPGYEEHNKLLQQERRKTATVVMREELLPKIVKTDALNNISLTARGLYEILPYDFGSSKKIVKTDALIVEIRSYHGIRDEVVLKSGRL